jgi:hypothetical protein
MNLSPRKMDRITLWSVTAIAFFVVLGGIAQIRSELFSHDKVASAIRGKLLNAINNANADSYLSNTNEGINLAELQTKDTDNDSLTDFEELYVHNTSPYLADSDSDTVTDPVNSRLEQIQTVQKLRHVPMDQVKAHLPQRVPKMPLQTWIQPN